MCLRVCAWAGSAKAMTAVGQGGEYIRSLLLPCIAQARRVGWVTAHGPRLQAIYHPTYGDLLAYTRRV